MNRKERRAQATEKKRTAYLAQVIDQYRDRAGKIRTRQVFAKKFH